MNNDLHEARLRERNSASARLLGSLEAMNERGDLNDLRKQNPYFAECLTDAITAWKAWQDSLSSDPSLQSPPWDSTGGD